MKDGCFIMWMFIQMLSGVKIKRYMLTIRMKHPILTEFPQIKHFGAEIFFLQLHMNFMIRVYNMLRESFKRPVLNRQRHISTQEKLVPNFNYERRHELYILQPAYPNHLHPRTAITAFNISQPELTLLPFSYYLYYVHHKSKVLNHKLEKETKR